MGRGGIHGIVRREVGKMLELDESVGSSCWQEYVASGKLLTRYPEYVCF